MVANNTNFNRNMNDTDIDNENEELNSMDEVGEPTSDI